MDRREQLYDDLLERTTADRPESERRSIAASVNLALSCDVHQLFMWKPLSPSGLARSSFNVLALLRHAHPEGLQLSDLGELLITSRANVTGIVDHLEQKGYVVRTVDSHDRRARLAKLTRKGEEVIDEVMPAHGNRAAAFFSSLSTVELEQLTTILKKLRHTRPGVEVQPAQGVRLDPVFAHED